MDNTNKFTGKAMAYAKARPNYSTEFIDYLFKDMGMCKDNVIADIGSGTGILSKELLKKGCTVYCVEPNEDMRLTAESILSEHENFISVNGTAEDTTISDNSVDYITVAQAFHWFDVFAFKKECKRILKHNGKVILVWNSRIKEDEFVKENWKVCKQHCPNFRDFSNGFNKDDSNIALFFDGKVEVKKFKNNLLLDRNKFIEGSLSASYALTESDTAYQDYLDALKGLFDKFAVEGILTMPNETVAYFGRI